MYFPVVTFIDDVADNDNDGNNDEVPIIRVNHNTGKMVNEDYCRTRAKKGGKHKCKTRGGIASLSISGS